MFYVVKLKSLKLDSMHYRRKRYDLIQLFKIVHGYEDIKPDIFFNSMITAQEDTYSK